VLASTTSACQKTSFNSGVKKKIETKVVLVSTTSACKKKKKPLTQLLQHDFE